MKNLLLTIALLFTAAVSAQQFYGAVGPSVDNKNVGAFFIAGLNTDEGNTIVISNELGLNAVPKNTYLRASVIPQYTFFPAEGNDGYVRVGFGASAFLRTSKANVGFTTRAEYIYNNNFSVILNSDFTGQSKATVQLGLKFKIRHGQQF